MLDWASIRNRPDVREIEQFSSSAVARTDLPQPPAQIVQPVEPKKQGIALALGGGAARGWAHIGVLRALDEAGIEIQMIAGTSIGALVGGCYLAGKLDQLEEFARSITKRRLFGLIDLRLGGNGLLGGLKLTQRMQEHMNGLTFAELDRPFVCVAAEIRTGHEIWLSSGSLITAMRASYALPGVFEPVNCNGRVLVDGALVNPVPVSVCRAHEQQFVVAVNLHYDLYGRAAVISTMPASWWSKPSRGRVPRTTLQRAVRASASPGSWSRPSTSSRTASRAPGSPAIRRICRCSPSSAISAFRSSTAPTSRSARATKRPRRCCRRSSGCRRFSPDQNASI